MAGQNDFLIFDESKENMLNQEAYLDDADRTDGFKRGLARSNVNNKVLHQTSIMASALGELIKKQGGQATDGAIANLVNNLNRLFSIKKYYLDATFDLNDVVIDTSDGFKLFISLQNNNTGHALTDVDYWEEVNLDTDDESRLHALKGYEDAGELLTDSEGLADVTAYAHSTFDLSKFTVVGSPTITNGVVSNVSNSDYITMASSFLTSSTWKMIVPLPKGSTGWGGIISRLGTGNSLQINLNTKTVAYSISSNGTSWDIGSSSFTFTDLDTTKDALFVLEFTGTEYKMYAIQNGTILTGTTITSSSNIYNNSGALVFGQNRGLNSPTNGTIDLKQVLVYANGVPVFNGNQSGTDTYTINGSTVTIPYVLSKTGSKIADSSYRTAVASVYNELGYSPYYTLSDTDFTLPQGEIYGLMLNQSTPHIVESYENGKSGYIVYSNGLCKQWGYLATNSSSTAEYTVTLFKTFKDTNYSFYRSPYWAELSQLTYYSFYDNGYTGKTTSTVSFWMHENTVQNGTDWVAFGYIN